MFAVEFSPAALPRRHVSTGRALGAPPPLRPRWVRHLVAAGVVVGLVAAAAWAPGAQAAVVNAPADEGSVLAGGLVDQAERAVERPLTELVPESLLAPRSLDLLLDSQFDAVNLAYSPVDAGSTAALGAAGLDVRALSPHAPANPMFPGYGLSYEPPGGGRGAPAPAAGTAEAGAGAAAAAPQDDWVDRPERPDRLSGVRNWIADHRLELLLALGGVAVAGAAVVTGRWRQQPRRRSSSSSGSSSRRRSSSRVG